MCVAVKSHRPVRIGDDGLSGDGLPPCDIMDRVAACESVWHAFDRGCSDSDSDLTSDVGPPDPDVGHLSDLCDHCDDQGVLRPFCATHLREMRAAAAGSSGSAAGSGDAFKKLLDDAFRKLE